MYVFSELCLLGVMIILKKQFASIYIHLLFICIFSMYVWVPVCLCGCLIIYSSITWALWTTNVDVWWAISSTSTITLALLSYPFVFCLYIMTKKNSSCCSRGRFCLFHILMLFLVNLNLFPYCKECKLSASPM